MHIQTDVKTLSDTLYYSCFIVDTTENRPPSENAAYLRRSDWVAHDELAVNREFLWILWTPHDNDLNVFASKCLYCRIFQLYKVCTLLHRDTCTIGKKSCHGEYVVIYYLEDCCKTNLLRYFYL